MRSAGLQFACLCLLAACNVGPQILDMEAPRQPHGADVIIDIMQSGRRSNREERGELIEVRQDGMVLLLPSAAGPRLTFAPWSDVYRVRATELKGYQSTQGTGGQRRPEGIERMRLISRYPQGMTDELMGRLLLHYGQQELDTLSN